MAIPSNKRIIKASTVDHSSLCSGCHADFDKSMCWEKSMYGERTERRCPFQYCTTVPGCERIAGKHRTEIDGERLVIMPHSDIHMVSRYCDLKGDWEVANYSQCLTVVNEFTTCIVGFCRVVRRFNYIFIPLSFANLTRTHPQMASFP